MSVSVAFDDGWVETFGLQAETEAADLLASTSRLFEPFCLRFRPLEFIAWSPTEAANSAQELHRLGVRDLSRFRGDYLLILSDSHLHGRVDGYASGRHALVRHHSQDREWDVVVIAHELGHLVGLRHHLNSCGCVMDQSGFTKQWCPFHQELLTKAAMSDAMLVSLGQAHRQTSKTPSCS